MELDTVVIGAGAAGIGAGLRLQQLGRRFILLEARPRAGGRAYTETSSLGFAIDHGAHWMHSADINPLVPIARRAGFHVRERAENWGAHMASAHLPPAEIDDLDRALDAFFTALGSFDLQGPDASIAALLAPGNRWRALIHAVMTFLCGAAPGHVSSADFAASGDTDVDRPVREGMGAVIAFLAQGLPVQTGTPVTAIDWSREKVRVTTPAGDLRCRQVVLTVPTNVLASGTLAFTPDLPAAKQQAIADLPLGINEKVFVPLTGRPLLDGREDIAYSSMASEDACSLHVQPFGYRYAMAFFGADAARDIAGLGNAGASHAVRTMIADVYGSAAAKSVGEGLVTQWNSDPFALGAYSYSPPGRRSARDVLAEPLHERLFFAGEATYPDHYATVHGAFMSGQLCAERLPAPV